MRLTDKAQQLLAGVFLLDDVVVDVRAVKAANELIGASEGQTINNLFPGRRVCRCRQGNPRHRRKALRENLQAQIILAKIVPPLGHTVGLIDRKQGDFNVLEHRQCSRLHQAFRRHIE